MKIIVIVLLVWMVLACVVALALGRAMKLGEDE